MANVHDVINFNPQQASTPGTITVPNAFDVAAPGIPGLRGTAFYRRTFQLTPNKAGLLYFAACSFYCQAGQIAPPPPPLWPRAAGCPL
jgi:hypothetical protein